RARQFGKRSHLVGESGVDVSCAGRSRGSECCRPGIAQHHRQLRITRLDSAIQVACGSRPKVEQLHDVTNGRRIELFEQLEFRLRNGTNIGHGHSRVYRSLTVAARFALRKGEGNWTMVS